MTYTPLPDFQKWVDAVFRITKDAFQPWGFPRYGGPAPPVEASALPKYTKLTVEAKTKSKKTIKNIPGFLRMKGTKAEMQENLWTVWNGWTDTSHKPPNEMVGFVRLGKAKVTNFNLGMGSSATMLGPFSMEGPTLPWMQLCGTKFKPTESKWMMPTENKILPFPHSKSDNPSLPHATFDEYFTFKIWDDTTVHDYPMQPGYTYIFTDATDTPLKKGLSIWFLTYADEPTAEPISPFEPDKGLFPATENISSKVLDSMSMTHTPALYGIKFACDANNKWKATIQNLTFSGLKGDEGSLKMAFPQPAWGASATGTTVWGVARTAVVLKNKGPVNDILQLQPLERHQYISDLELMGMAGHMELYAQSGFIVANFAVNNPKVGWKRVFKKELEAREARLKK